MALACVIAVSPASADWPMARHDAQRRGASPGTSNITKPKIAWSAYLGGSLRANSILAADVDGDGQSEIIRYSGGNVAALKANGTVVWKTKTAGTTTLLGFADLNGDGAREIVAYTSLGALALDLKSGSIVWSQTPGEMGSLRHVRVADVTGDGKPDLIIAECRGCGGDKPQTGFIYSFPMGFAAPQRVPLAYPDTNAGYENTPVDTDNKNGAELLIGTSANVLAIADGKTAAVVAKTGDLAFGSSYVSGCVPGEIDGIPGQEAICIASTGDEAVPGPMDTSRVFALKRQPGSPTLDVLWSYSLAPKEALSTTNHNLMVDLDGDGRFETVVTGRDANGGHTTHILDSATGKEIVSIPGEIVSGAAPVGTSGRILVTHGAKGVSLWSFVKGAIGALGTINDDYAAGEIDPQRAMISSASSALIIAIDANGDGTKDILTVNLAGNTLHASTPGTQPPPLVGSLALAVDTPLSGVFSLPPTDRTYPQIAVAQSDGTLHFLDHSFTPTADTLRVGGYYIAGAYHQLGLSPVVASLDGGKAQQIVVGDSRGVLVALDASSATVDTPPKKLWEQSWSTSPVVVPNVDGPRSGIFVIHIVDPRASPTPYALRRLGGADGSVKWEFPLPSGESPPNDILVGHFDADAVPDVVLQSGKPGVSDLQTRVLSGFEGNLLWQNTVTGCQLSGGAMVVDWNGDGVDDVVQQLVGVHVASGVDGTEIAKGGPTDCYYLPIPLNLATTNLDALVFQGGFTGEQVYAHDLTTKLYATTEDDRPYPYGAIATCPEGPVLVEGSWAFPSRLKMTPLALLGAVMPRTLFLAGGASYTDQATADAISTAQLTAVNVHANLTGKGGPTAVVGSGDGFLYAIDPCTGELVFTYDFGAPVGEPVFGDTNGDGIDEIVVSVDDGYLYALSNDAMISGTGGGGAGGAVGVGGFGGFGGAGGGSGGTTHHRSSGPPILIYGRGGCYCEASPGSPEPPALVVFAVVAVALARRKRRS